MVHILSSLVLDLFPHSRLDLFRETLETQAPGAEKKAARTNVPKERPPRPKPPPGAAAAAFGKLCAKVHGGRAGGGMLKNKEKKTIEIGEKKSGRKEA